MWQLCIHIQSCSLKFVRYSCGKLFLPDEEGHVLLRLPFGKQVLKLLYIYVFVKLS